MARKKTPPEYGLSPCSDVSDRGSPVHGLCSFNLQVPLSSLASETARLCQ